MIAPETFIPALAPLVQHKSQTGIPALAISIESITGSISRLESPEEHAQAKLKAPESIKRAILYAYEKLSTKYVMLVGDAQNFPVRFWFSHDGVPPYPGASTMPSTPPPLIPCQPSGGFVQSDLYYANLYHHTGTDPVVSGAFDDWDANGNGLFNEAWMGNFPNLPSANPGGLNTALNPDNVDGYPDLAVGRVPARNVNDVAVYVQKIITYETTIAQKVAGTFTFVHDEIYGALNLTTDMVTASGLANTDSPIQYFLIENSSSVPALTVFNGSLWTAFADGNGNLQVCSSADGQNWPASSFFPVTNQSSSVPPAAIAFAPAGQKQQLWVAFVATNGSNDILLCSSADGQIWPASNVYMAVKGATNSSPSLAVFNEQLWMAYIDLNNNLQVRSSPTGKPGRRRVPSRSRANRAPTLPPWRFSMIGSGWLSLPTKVRRTFSSPVPPMAKPGYPPMWV
jgi:hypothetical protein